MRRQQEERGLLAASLWTGLIRAQAAGGLTPVHTWRCGDDGRPSPDSGSGSGSSLRTGVRSRGGSCRHGHRWVLWWVAHRLAQLVQQQVLLREGVRLASASKLGLGFFGSRPFDWPAKVCAGRSTGRHRCVHAGGDGAAAGCCTHCCVAGAAGWSICVYACVCV